MKIVGPCAATAVLWLWASSAVAQVIVLYGWSDGDLRVVSLRHRITTFEVRGLELIPENVKANVLTSPFDRIDAAKLFKFDATGFRHAHFGSVLPPYRSIYGQLVINGSVVARDGTASSLQEAGISRLILPADPLAVMQFILGWLVMF